jgi:trk system potassium uptake protein TrkA
MLPGIFSGLDVKILSIFRDNEIIIPTGKMEIYPGDDIYLCLKNKDLLRALRVFGIKSEDNRKIVMVGAGNIGLNIIKILEKDYPNILCKIIDNDVERTKKISSVISEQNTILCGDALDSNILKEAGTVNAEAIISVTDDDEVNIFSSLLAKDLGCKRSMAIVGNSHYRRLSKKLDLDVLINPGNITTSAILQYVRRGKVKEIHDFGNDRGEIMEIEILATTKFADKKISDLTIPDGVVIGGIVRNKKLIFPDEETIIFVKDKLIIFSDPSSIKDIEKYSEVNIEFF